MKKKIIPLSTMYLDITRKIGDQSAVKASDQLIKDLEAKLQVAVEVMERINIGDLEYGEIYEELSMALKKIKV